MIRIGELRVVSKCLQDTEVEDALEYPISLANNTNEMISFSLKKILLPSILTAVAIGASSAAFAAQAEDRNDFPTESNKCTDAWEKAFHKANGADAPIAYDQAWEFVDNCRAGKYPPQGKETK